MLNLIAIGTGLTVVLAAIGFYYSYYLFKKYGSLSSGWLFITLGMATVVVHRCIVFIIDYNAYPPSDQTFITLKEISAVIYFLMMAMIVYGFWKLKLMFDKYDIVNKEILGKIRSIDRKMGGKKRKKN